MLSADAVVFAWFVWDSLGRGWARPGSAFGIAATVLAAISVLGSVGIAWKKEWGRRIQFGVAMLLQISALVASSWFVLTTAFSGAGLWYTTLDISAATIVSISTFLIASYLAFLLESAGAISVTGGRSGCPPGVWPITVPMILSVIGAAPGIGLLLRREWARRVSVICVWIIAALAVTGASLATTTRMAKYQIVLRTSAGIYYCSKGIGAMIIVVLVILAWCVAAFRYLRSAPVKAWFREG